MKLDIRELNRMILEQAKDLRYIVKAEAPSTEVELFNAPSLVIWSGASDNTIYKDATINYAFRAIHDAMHLKTGLGFTVLEEIEMGRIQAAQLETKSALLAKLFYIEIAGQAQEFLKTGQFVEDQVSFTLKQLSQEVKV